MNKNNEVIMITQKELQEKIKNAEKQNVSIQEIKFDKTIYSRKQGFNRNAINDYSKDIMNMPPIIVNQNNQIIDGVHRFKALQKAEQKTCDVKKIILDEKDLMFASLLIDKNQGVRHPREDFKYVLVKDFEKRPGLNKDIAKELGIPERTANEWTKDIRREKQKEVNESIALDLLNPNNTQQQIAEKWGYTNRRIKQIKNDLGEILAKLAEISLEDLQQKDYDFLERYKDFIENEIFLYNIWNTHKGDNSTHFGHFPQIFMKNLLYYHTKPFDLIYDPFAGSGTTIDACKLLLRKYICSDIKPVGDRQNEIFKHDITTGLPEIQKPDLVFLDPPYWILAENQYTENNQNDLGNMGLEEFRKTMKNLIKELINKKVNKIAYLIRPIWITKNDWEWIDPMFEFYNYLQDKYEIETRYVIPYSTEQYNATMVNKAKETNKPLVLNRELIVFKLKK